MRGAKRRWYRPRNVALGVLGAVTLWLGWGVYLAWTAKPGDAVDYFMKVQELAASHQPGAAPDPNAWDPFTRAVATLRAAEEEFLGAAGGEDAKPADWPEDYDFPFDLAAIRAADAPAAVVEPTLRMMAMLRDRGADAALAEMAATPRAIRPLPDDLEDLTALLLPDLGAARQLARWCAARMRVASAAGDTGEVIAAFEQGLALARVLGSQPTMAERLTAIAITSLIVAEAGIVLGDEPDAAVCRGMLGAMDRQLPLPPLELALEGERLTVMDAIQWTHTDNGRGSGRLMFTEIWKVGGGRDGPAPKVYRSRASNIAGFLFPTKAETTAKANEYYDNLIRVSRLTPSERGADPFDADRYAESIPRGYILLRELTPALGRALQSNDQHEVQVQDLRLRLALEAYRAEHGEYPERLEDLVPAVLAEVPIDPFTRGPYAYRRLTEAEAKGGRRYTLSAVSAGGGASQGPPQGAGSGATPPR